MKGSAWERDVAKFFTLWASGKKKPYWFWRTPGSGAMATLSLENKELSGDIHALHIDGCFLTDLFSIELKDGYPKGSFYKHLKSNKADSVRGFWAQCCSDALRASKRPMLIWRKLNHNAVVGIENWLNDELCDVVDLFVLPSLMLRFNTDLPDVAFYDMKKFFDVVKPITIKEVKNGQ